jgi:hypothetical protein
VTGTTWQAPAVAPTAALAQPATRVAVAPPAAVAAAPAAALAAPAAPAEPAEPAVEPAVQAAATAAIASPSALFAVLAHAEPSSRYYEKLRAEVRWMPVRVGARKLATPDARSRLLLAQSAAELAELDEVGLDFRDVYGVINAETTWVPRTGMGKNGVTSHGLAQFEPGTAKAVGLSNPNDPVEAVHAAAVLLREAAAWSKRRIAALDLTPEMHAVKLREGISIYYNLSSKARRQWSGANTQQLPVETLRHIRNVRVGAAQAEALHERIAGTPTGFAMTHVNHVPAPVVEAPARVQHAVAVRTDRPAPSAKARSAAPTRATKVVVVADRAGRKTWVLPQGTIAWSKG